ncbi:ATP-binding protein [Streptomyces sp. WAC08241]|uniref:ATP-binding protein n=1 Tax=Streptomyces sp. WAC08241 TaxID=2487421 RepID=UPI000F7B87AD|nr:ATP-binding protein [Streptomyces sp. WAC08241]RSS43696.1 ATP-binding protein [Streptomyces sp. WAC08241]
MSIWWSLHLRREAASVPLARRLLLGTMETAGVDPDVSYELSVALTEACANAVEHGGAGAAPGTVPDGPDGPDGPGGALSGAYRVTAYLDGETCRIEVADSGPGFPYAELPAAPADAEHGRGMRLIEELSDHVQFGNRSGRGGAVVSFDKILKWKDTPSLLMA